MIDANLDALGRRYPALAERLRNTKVSVEGVTVEESGTGRPYLRSGDTALEDAHDPAGEARKIMASVGPNRRMVVIKGSGLGYLWKAAHALRHLEHIVCIEPELALFALMLSVNDFRRLLDDPRVDLYIGQDAYDAVKHIRSRYDFGTETGKMLIVLPPNVVVRHPVIAASTKFENAFDEEWSAAQKVSDRNWASLERFCGPWRRHIAENLPAILSSGPLAQLAGAARGVPGILVGAGPSLDRNVRALKAAKGRSVIVAVDTAYRTLKISGVIPDFVVAIDATEENANDFRGVTVGDDPTSLVMVPVVHPVIPRLFQRRFVTGYGHPFQKWIEAALGQEFGSLLVSGSVSTLGFDLLRFMRAEPIILAGMDFAVGTTSHSRGAAFFGVDSRFGSIEQTSTRRGPKASIERPGWGGGNVKTTEQMARWAAWFEKEIGEGGQKTVNATEGGVRIAGAMEMTLHDAISRYCKRAYPVPAPKPFDAASRAKVFDLLAHISDVDLDTILAWDRAVLSPENLEGARDELRRMLYKVRQ